MPIEPPRFLRWTLVEDQVRLHRAKYAGVRTNLLKYDHIHTFDWEWE